MAITAEAITRMSGSRPTPGSIELLEAALLPGEEILGGVSGGAGLLSSEYLFLTRSSMFFLEERLTTSQLTWIGLAELTGWEVKPGWASVEVVFGTTNGVVALPGVNEKAAIPFVHLVNRLQQDVAEGSWHRSLLPFAQAFEELLGAVNLAMQDAAVGKSLPGETALLLSATDAADLLASVIKVCDFINLELAESLWACLILSNRVQPGRRGDLVRECIAKAPKEPDPLILQARCALPDSELMQACASSLSQVVESWISLLGVDTSREVVDKFRSVSARIRPEMSPSMASPSGAAENQGGSVEDKLARLERINALRASSAITEEEFAHLKATILNAPPGY